MTSHDLPLATGISPPDLPLISTWSQASYGVKDVANARLWAERGRAMPCVGLYAEHRASGGEHWGTAKRASSYWGLPADHVASSSMG